MRAGVNRPRPASQHEGLVWCAARSPAGAGADTLQTDLYLHRALLVFEKWPHALVDVRAAKGADDDVSRALDAGGNLADCHRPVGIG